MIRTNPDPGFADWRRDLSVSAWQPPLTPAAIARPRSAEHVADLLARHEAGPIAVRSGGHSLSATHLRPGALTLDLRHLDHVTFTGDVARVDAGVTVAAVAEHLSRRGRAFPVGHAPTVGLAGYLLAGGNGWNGRVWGHGCDFVRGAQVVIPGERPTWITEGDDLFEVLRGAGPLFPGVVTAFDLETLPEPAHIRRRFIGFQVRDPARTGAGLDRLLARLPASVEVALFWRPGTPPTLDVAVTEFAAGPGTSFLREFDGFARGAANDRTIEVGPHLADLIRPLPTNAGDAIFSHHLWTDRAYADILPRLPTSAPGREGPTCILLTAAAAPVSSSGVYRPRGKISISAYAHWDPGRDDAAAHLAWARESITDLDDIRTGRYLGEADLTAGIQLCEYFSPAQAATIRAAAARHDPTGRFIAPERDHP